GTRPWITTVVRYDPGETLVLVGAVLLLVSLVVMLLGRRLRVWFRIPPTGAASAGALARSAYPGFTTEFDSIVEEARRDGRAVGPPAGGGDPRVRAGDAGLRGGVRLRQPGRGGPGRGPPAGAGRRRGRRRRVFGAAGRGPGTARGRAGRR